MVIFKKFIKKINDNLDKKPKHIVFNFYLKYYKQNLQFVILFIYILYFKLFLAIFSLINKF